jgi:hypothetical protein
MARKAKRREWTAGDVRELKSLAKKKMPAGKIAKSLKRTVGDLDRERLGSPEFVRKECAQ